MKTTKIILSIALLIVSTSVMISCSAKSTAKTDKTEAENVELAKMITKTNNAHEIPEVRETYAIGNAEIKSATESYGIAEYNALYPEIIKLQSEFNSNPNEQTKTALLSFLKEHKLFAEILKPAPKELYDKAFAQNIIIGGYIGAETDYAKIEEYYDKQIESYNGNGNSIVARTSISFDNK